MPSKRVSITQYQREYFERGSAPTRNTIINWIKGDHLAGEQLGPPSKKGPDGKTRRGGMWVVYPDRPPINAPGSDKLQSLIEEFESKVVSYGDGKAT